MSDSHDDNRITTGTRKDATVAGRARRGLILPAAVAAGTLAAALLSATPAHAGGTCHLWYYVNYDGSPYWPPVTPVDPGYADNESCSMPPAIARYNGGSVIAATSADTADFGTYVNTDGSTQWWKNDGWGGLPPPQFGPPALVPYSGGTEFAVFGTAFSGLIYGWEAGGSPARQSGEVLTNAGTSQNAPAMARTSTATEIAATGADDSLWFYWNIDGTPTWGSSQIAGPWTAYGTPAITADDNVTEVAYIGADAGLYFDWIINGTTTWHTEQVSGPGTVNSGLAMTHSDGGIQIAAQGPRGALLFFWATDGTTTWHPEQIAGPGTMQGTPAMVSSNYIQEIAVTATDGSLRYYWAYYGTPTWYGAQIAPPGSTTSSPAMTRASGSTEIAVAGP